MSHSRLLRVADLFNSRLPSPTRIPDTTADADIRHSIENLVGITPIPLGGVPKAAKPTNVQDVQTVSNCIEDTEAGWNISPPSSPLAKRASRKLKRGNSWTQLPQFLDVLPEEDEAEGTSLGRANNKKQKLDANQA